MPPRSLLLNVSITAKEIDDIGKQQALESVREIETDNGAIQPREGLKGGRQERIDSAASIQDSPLLHNVHTYGTSMPVPATIAAEYTNVTTISHEAARPTPHSLYTSHSEVCYQDQYPTTPSACGTCNFADSPSSSPNSTSSTSSLYRCSRCKKQRYCSKKCQRADWPSHKQLCTPPAYLAGAEIDRSNTPALSPGQF